MDARRKSSTADRRAAWVREGKSATFILELGSTGVQLFVMLDQVRLVEATQPLGQLAASAEPQVLLWMLLLHGLPSMRLSRRQKCSGRLEWTLLLQPKHEVRTHFMAGWMLWQCHLRPIMQSKKYKHASAGFTFGRGSVEGAILWLCYNRTFMVQKVVPYTRIATRSGTHQLRSKPELGAC